MTVENPNVKNTYGGNGVTTVFPFTFLLNAEDVNNVVVTLTNERGQENVTTDFTLSLNDKVVRYPKSGVQPLPHGWKITIQRQIPYTQTLNLTSQGPFFAEDIEAQLDRQEMQIQQLAEIVERTVRVSVSSDIDTADLIAKIFQTGVDVSAQLLAAQQSASAAAGSEVNAKNSEDAVRTMTEQVHAVFANSVAEIKKALGTEYVSQEQAKETRRILDDKAPIASPALTGTPTVPTATKGTSTDQIASTAFVSQAIADADAKASERALKIAILTGTVAGGETIPLPDGYTEDQCKWIVSVRTKQVDDDDTITCHTDEHRVVTCWTYQRGNKGTVNYMIIGVK